MDPEDWSISSNDAISITLLDPKTGKPTADAFKPAFTYSMFDEHETIFGYKDLKINLLFSADSMKPCLTISYSKKVPAIGDVEAEDVQKILEDYLPEGPSPVPPFLATPSNPPQKPS